MSQELNDQQVAESEVQQNPYVTLLEKHNALIKEVTGCTEEQASLVGEVTSAMIAEAIDFILNDPATLQSIYTNMMRVQINNNTRLENITEAQKRREFIVVDEQHPVADLRVTYVGEEPSSWVFEQVEGEGWSVLQLAEGQQRLNLEALTGKFFNGRVGHVGYVVEVTAMQKYDESKK